MQHGPAPNPPTSASLFEGGSNYRAVDYSRLRPFSGTWPPPPPGGVSTAQAVSEVYANTAMTALAIIAFIAFVLGLAEILQK